MYDRSKSVGASDAVYIQAGQWAELWDRKRTTDKPDYDLPAELGHKLEAFNLELFARETGLELFVDECWQDSPLYLGQMEGQDQYEWCKYLPDALVQHDLGWIPVEAKCINMMWKPENLLKKYMPQLQHAMRVVGAPFCYFSVIYLNTRYEQTTIPYDPPYDDALFEKEKLFYWFLEQETRPPQKKGRKWI